jgi:hypothetical protein
MAASFSKSWDIAMLVHVFTIHDCLSNKIKDEGEDFPAGNTDIQRINRK